MTVVVGVDGAGRTHRLGQLAAASGTRAWWVGAGDLATEFAAATLVVADDAHRLAPEVLRAVTAAARSGVRVLVSRRPTITSPELADLDEAAAVDGVEVLAPLSPAEVGAVVATVTGRPVSPEVAAAVHEASAGLPGVAVAVTPTGAPAPALLARVQRRFAVLPPRVGTVARLLALRLDLPDDVLATATGVPVEELPGVLRLLRDEGLLVPGGERMVPAVAEAVLGELSLVERRRQHEAAARALASSGANPLVTAAQLRAARVRTPTAAEVYRQAGELTRFTDPAAALSWFDDALDAGATEAFAGRAEASALLGLPPDLDQHAVRPEDATRLTRLAGAVAAHDGRANRSAELLLAAQAPLLAVPVLIGMGRLSEAESIPLDGAGAHLAEAVLTAARDPDAAVPLLIEAAEVAERTAPVAVLPDTPHAIGAIVAVLVGDVAAAEYLLDRANRSGIGGPAAAERHRLLLAWAHMRAGRYDTALALPTGGELPARERLLRASIAAGMARRRGDIAALRAVWREVEPVLARRAVDLWQLEPVEELLVAAARLRHARRVEPIVEALEHAVDQLGRPPAWAAALGWLRVQIAVASDDPTTATTQASRLAAVPARPGDILPPPESNLAASPPPRRDATYTATNEPPAVLPEPVRKGLSYDTTTDSPTPATDTRGQAHPPAPTERDFRAPGGPPVSTLPEGTDNSGRPPAAGSQPPTDGQPPTGGQPPASSQPSIGSQPPTGGHRAAAQCAAANLWAQVLAGSPIPPDTVLAVSEQLVVAQLPWEASRLAGQAAIHATDPVVARRLLERARELSEPDAQDGAAAGGLSERELAVAKLVLAGSTHREIGAQLYISPKTVEHHVARIRTKLGAGSRAELLATLREILADQA